MSNAMAVETTEKRGFFAKVVSFYNDVMSEMAKVTWPDRAQLKDATIKIIIFVLAIGALIGLLDLLLQAILVKGIPSLFSGR